MEYKNKDDRCTTTTYRLERKNTNLLQVTYTAMTLAFAARFPLPTKLENLRDIFQRYTR